MRIGIEAQRIFRPKKHGMDVVAIELIKNLQQLDYKNEYVIFSRKGVDDNTIVETSNFTLDKFSALTYVDWEQFQLPGKLKSRKIDLLHCTANTAPLKCSIPLLLTLHDIIYLENVDFKGTAYQNLGNLYRRWLVPKIVNKASLILTVSEFEKQNILERLPSTEGKVQVLYNGVSPQFNNNYSQKQVEELRTEFNLPAQFVMFLGNTAPKKNTLNVIKAYVDLCLKHENKIPLVLLDYKKELVIRILEELKQPGLIDMFIFPGYVPHHKIPLVYNAATLFLYPSLRESFGLPILEAMACGTPVITSSTSSMPEIAGDAALLVDPYKPAELTAAMHKSLTNNNLLADLKERGLKRASCFTWKASAEKLLQIYESLR
ncbi:glycosyltransferase family 4 protein [Flavisolibacter ginsengisoli]|jgi:glycosyltransferase involved in cell wall biosynthesis|uniref:Glycosyltransferase involved in cell wall bisynthesis n=1 Tax=Flavisolibacter ginsengisoli DSM 18119 TaxID=1121884 RepID=A0A1M5GGF1_9BACT|nr:glycosyltransferase family 1 protein [Flavisolibacter ginsengisoli]SHG02793.1 Glycosyltransferase involved in cell wall bisynthesis [Flavisolibacter ginsengisoli DSM 18119]